MLAGIVVLTLVIWASLQVGLPLMRQAATNQARVVTQSQPVPADQPPGTAATEPANEAEPRPNVPELPRDTNATIERAQSSAPRVRPAPRRVEVPLQPVPAAPPSAAVPPVNAAPTATVNHFDLAVRHHNLGNYEQALTHYTAAIQEDEFNVEARNNLGLLYHERGLLNEAMQQFRRALAINPQYLRARSNLAVVLMDAGRLAEARAELRAALAASPRSADLLVNMALVEKADEHPEQAREILIRALGHEPLHAAAHYNLALMYDEAGETGRAYSHYSDFLKNAGPEYGARLSDVQRRVDAIAPTLNR